MCSAAAMTKPFNPPGCPIDLPTVPTAGSDRTRAGRCRFIERFQAHGSAGRQASESTANRRPCCWKDGMATRADCRVVRARWCPSVLRRIRQRKRDYLAVRCGHPLRRCIAARYVEAHRDWLRLSGSPVPLMPSVPPPQGFRCRSPPLRWWVAPPVVRLHVLQDLQLFGQYPNRLPQPRLFSGRQ